MSRFNSQVFDTYPDSTPLGCTGRKRRRTSPVLEQTMPTPAHSKSKAPAGSLRDPDSPGRLTLVHELVHATENQALKFWDELRFVKSGPEDASKIHEIAIGCVTMVLGTAVPLMHALLSDGVVIGSPSMPSHLKQNTPLTQTPLAAVTPSSCAPSLEYLRCALPKHSASNLAQPISKASDVSRQPVQEWRDLTLSLIHI